jgi:hypothetical protein
VANGGGQPPGRAPSDCCIAGPDGQPRPCRSAWLVAFQPQERSSRRAALLHCLAIQQPGVVHRRLLRFVPSGSDEGRDAGGCSAMRATARCACWSSRIGPPASTGRTPPVPLAEPHHRPECPTAAACHLLTSRGSAHGAGWLPTFRIGPPFVFKQVRVLDPRAPCLWRRAGASACTGRDPLSCSYVHGAPARFRDRVCPQAASDGTVAGVEIVAAPARERHSLGADAPAPPIPDNGSSRLDCRKARKGASGRMRRQIAARRHFQ